MPRRSCKSSPQSNTTAEKRGSTTTPGAQFRYKNIGIRTSDSRFKIDGKGKVVFGTLVPPARSFEPSRTSSSMKDCRCGAQITALAPFKVARGWPPHRFTGFD